MMMKNSLYTLILLCFSTMLKAQDKLELSFGDPAPALRYSKWIQGTPVTSLTGDKIYVLEFWATWCKPCIEAMPHLSDLAEKYADRMKVIGVNVFERTSGQTYESSLPSVETFLKQNADKMRFDVIADNNAREMSNNWLQKAHVVGIPATIIVKENQVLWIGHPAFLDKVLIEIFENKYDLKRRKQEYEEGMLSSMRVRGIYDTNMKKIDDALAKKDYKASILAADEAIKSDTSAAFQYRLKKLQVLLVQADKKAVEIMLKETAKYDQSQGLALAGYISHQDNLPREYALTAIEIIDKSKTANAYYLDLMATMQSKLGDYKGALGTQQRALEAMKQNELKSPGKIKPETFAEFENKIQKYRDALKK
ncbi:TlpA family protein disulfide reductase [Pedobacter sp. GR22-6]|uniref:TlpA family protein disulfide reductase n=1 Tax=Pedobacter sp. GR22-6 TaxID=3127957 RepID=UPI00307DADBF